MTDTIAAIATAQAPGALGVVRISGPDARAVADRVFRAKNGKPLSQSAGYTMRYGHAVQDGETIDEVVALVFAAPHSYTGEDVIELDCHGGLVVTSRVLQAVLQAGARAAEAGEFTKRAFLNGRISLTQAEAVMGIIGAQGKNAARASQAALSGKTAQRIAAVTQDLTHAAAALAAWTDYPEDDVPAVDGGDLEQSLYAALQKVEDLLCQSESGKAFTQGIPTAIVGRPNVGKSPLMNLLAGEERSIVTQIAGTTRDVVEETVSFAGVLLRLSDTAGIHETADEVEQIGVARAKERLQQASLVFAVFDQSNSLEDEDLCLAEQCKGRNAVCIINKSDLPARFDAALLEPYFCQTVSISAKEGDGLEQLQNAVTSLLGTAALDPAAGLLTTARQLDCARAARDALLQGLDALQCGMTLDAVGVCVDDAIAAMLSLSGERVSERVVQEIFASFCVGK